MNCHPEARVFCELKDQWTRRPQRYCRGVRRSFARKERALRMTFVLNEVWSRLHQVARMRLDHEPNFFSELQMQRIPRG